MSGRSSPWLGTTGWEVVAAIVCFFGLGVSEIVFSLFTPFPRPFFEMDPSLSYPLVPADQMTVPLWLLLLLSVGIPLVTVPALVVLVPVRLPVLDCSVFARPSAAVLGLFQALLLNSIATDALKTLAGRKRPDFFAMCDYAGYRSVNASNVTDLQAWISKENIVAGALGSMSRCRAAPSAISESCKSFPSGHASISACGLGYLTYVLFAFFWRFREPGATAGGGGRDVLFSAAALVPAAIAGWVAVSRTQDNWHNFSDVLAGSIIGASASAIAFCGSFSDGLFPGGNGGRGGSRGASFFYSSESNEFKMEAEALSSAGAGASDKRFESLRAREKRFESLDQAVGSI